MSGPLPGVTSGRCQTVSAEPATSPCQRTESPAMVTESLLGLAVTRVPDWRPPRPEIAPTVKTEKSVTAVVKLARS